jgi:hypothetical protein
MANLKLLKTISPLEVTINKKSSWGSYCVIKRCILARGIKIWPEIVCLILVAQVPKWW